MFRFSVRLVMVLALTAAAIPAAAQTTIGLIDVQKVVTESDRGKEAFQRLRELEAAKIEQGKTMTQEFEALKENFNKQRYTLSEEKVEAMTKEIEDKSIQLKRYQDDAQRELEAARRKELDKLEQSLMPIVQTVGDDMNFTLIFDKFRAGLLYADEGIDISDEVIKRFNAAQ